MNKEKWAKLQEKLAFCVAKIYGVVKTAASFCKKTAVRVWKWAKPYLHWIGQKIKGLLVLIYLKLPPKKVVIKYVKKGLPYATVAVGAAAVTVLVMFAPYLKLAQTSKISQLESLILDYYVDDVDKEGIEDAAAQAMIDALGDRWSYYIPADEYAQYQESKENSYVGIGVTIRKRSDAMGLDVENVTAGGAAEKAGIQAGDIITAVDGQSIQGMADDLVKEMIRGREGTKVQITVLRGEEEKTFSVIRERIATTVASGRLLENGIGVVRIVNFNDNCAKETKAAINDLRIQGATKLIFDVRTNPGGYLTELVEILDYLLPEGEILSSVDYRGKEQNYYSDAECVRLPMAVLVNGKSYSAAEFFAAALSEYDVAVLVGEQTSGKGYLQNTFLLPDGSAVGLSTGKYYTPNGISLEGIGLTPDKVVPVNEATASGIYNGTLTDAQDPQLQAAIGALTEE